MRTRACLSLAVLTVCAAMAVAADRDILADSYLDRLHGMWLGEILGNYAGRPTEGVYGSGWPLGNPAVSVDWSSFISTSPWGGDDDTAFEYMNRDVLLAHTNPTNQDIQAAWEAHIPVGSFYIANKQARWLMDEGYSVPQTGSINWNMHWYAIDSQITTEAIGSAAPGMRQRAADLAGRFGSVTNDGYAVHAAQFYAAIYADAAMDSNVESIVAKGLEVVPVTSRTHQVIQDVIDWYHADQADGVLDWRATHQKLYDKYVGSGSYGRYRYWVESTVNTGLTTLALLYGQGDFKQTVTIGMLGGFDNDCSTATAGGLIGMVRGYSGLPGDLTSVASDSYHLDAMTYTNPDSSITQIAQGWQTAAEAQILAAGGTITGTGSSRTYHVPGTDTVVPPPEKPDPIGPAGLVGQVRKDGRDGERVSQRGGAQPLLGPLQPRLDHRWHHGCQLQRPPGVHDG